MQAEVIGEPISYPSHSQVAELDKLKKAENPAVAAAATASAPKEEEDTGRVCGKQEAK